MRKLLSLAPALLLAFAACGDDSNDVEATLRVTNDSDFRIVQLFLTDVDNPDFGPNLLGNNALDPGEEIVLGVSCGLFDALLVDEDNVDCELHDLDLCLNSAVFIIRNNTCTVFGARKAEREAAQKPADSIRL